MQTSDPKSRTETVSTVFAITVVLALTAACIFFSDLTLTDLQTALEKQAATLATRESELEAAQATLEEQKTLLSQQESELEVRDAALVTSQAKLDEQNQLMSEQQEKIDQIIGVKADLIDSLNKEFATNQINVDIDSQTGAIVLDSSVLFDLDEYVLTDLGQETLSQILPVYCQVLLSDEYRDYVAEIIIDGYTDSQGDYLMNLTLSQSRAYAVAEYLLQISGGFLDNKRAEDLQEKLTANGRSESNLIYKEDGQEDQESSRRVEVKFRLKDEEMIQELSDIIADARTAGETGGN